MPSFSWSYEFQGAAKLTVVSVIFGIVGLLLLAVPSITIPTVKHPVEAIGSVVRIDEDEDGSTRAVFAFQDASGTRREFPDFAYSATQGYQLEQAVTVQYEASDSRKAIVKDNPSASFLTWVMRALAIPFLAIALLILVLRGRKEGLQSIETKAGMIGALSFAIPAFFALPVLWYLYSTRPNAIYPMNAVFETKDWVIGGIFSLLGALTFVGSVFLYRYQMRTGKAGWSWSWSSEQDKKEEQAP